MKTNDNVKMSRSQGVEELRSGRPRPDRESPPRAAGRKSAADSSPSGLLNKSTANSGEQSQDVYENKGQVQKVAESYSATPSASSRSSGRRSEAELKYQDHRKRPPRSSRARGLGPASVSGRARPESQRGVKCRKNFVPSKDTNQPNGYDGIHPEATRLGILANLTAT